MTDEDRKRIEEEEQYRASIRQRMATDASTRRTEKNGRILAFVILAIGLIVIVGGVISNIDMSSGPPKPESTPIFRREPLRRNVVNDTVSVTAGQSRWYTIQVPTLATLYGSFAASGGFGNDIQAAIMTAPELPNWVNGHVAQVFWRTPGPETVGSFNLRLAPGTYCIAFSNRQSIFSTKQLSVKADLIY
jgi:hypothetical protein